uniref:Calpain catalytic domain-containing protein n=1 Tax=Stegastes partitus TaxID=144197 RepID=A0A3B4Z861_9TELE
STQYCKNTPLKVKVLHEKSYLIEVLAFKNQDYAQLKDNCLRRRRQFVDNTFPPNNRSLGDLPSLTSWQEDDVDDEPTFCVKGASRFDFGQGSVGKSNCWFLAAISSLTFQKRLMAQVVPMDQSFSNYAGIFHFRFWRFGKWVDVVIDDYLPTYNKQLLSVHCKGGNEFWVPLLEKAYAKVCGTYADMTAGLPSEACKDFSGGVSMTYKLREEHTSGHDDQLWLQLGRATGCKSMVCFTEVKLVRVMNPWGKQEWQGDWSDKSDLWDRVRPEDREKCAEREDGEFWMKLEDFCYYFTMASISCENPNFLDGDLDVQWQCMIYDGSWVAGRSAGGNVNNCEPSFILLPSNFATRTTLYLCLLYVQSQKPAHYKNILLSLMQKPQQEYRKKIRYYPTPAGRLRSSFFRRNRPIKRSQSYSSGRELIELHSLEPGEYVIIPSTMKAYMTADFVLSVYTKSDAKIT